MLCHRRRTCKKNNQKLLQSYGRKRHSQGKSYDKQIIKNQIEWRQKMIFIFTKYL
jgi:CRISPR/Cas system-associated protein Csx1